MFKKKNLGMILFMLIIPVPFTIYFLLSIWGWLFFGHTPNEDRMAVSVVAAAFSWWLFVLFRIGGDL